MPIPFTRSLTACFVLTLATVPDSTQGSPVPTDEVPPQDPAKPAAQIKGKIIKPKPSVEPGGHVPSGSTLKIEFAYQTSVPGEVEVGVQGIVSGKAVGAIGSSRFELSTEAGNGAVHVINMGSNDLIIDELTLSLVLKTTAQGGRSAIADRGQVASTIKGPFRFAGKAKVAETAPKFLMAQIDPAASDQVFLMTPRSRATSDDKQKSTRSRSELAFVPEIKIFLREVRAHRLDGKPVDANQLPQLLAKPRLVLIVPNERLNTAILETLKEDTLLLVVSPNTFERPAPEWERFKY